MTMKINDFMTLDFICILLHEKDHFIRAFNEIQHSWSYRDRSKKVTMLSYNSLFFHNRSDNNRYKLILFFKSIGCWKIKKRSNKVNFAYVHRLFIEQI